MRTDPLHHLANEAGRARRSARAAGYRRNATVLRFGFQCGARGATRPTVPELRSSLKLELIAFALILIIANAPLLGGSWRGQVVFFPGAVGSGEWWRVFTHPFVHVSWYHLLLDGAAFLMLYAELGGWRT